MGLVDDYMTDIRPKVSDGVFNFLNTADRKLRQYIEKEAERTVYSYEATPEAEEQRRYQIGNDDALYTSVDGDENISRITILNMTRPHDPANWGSRYITDPVETGEKAFNQDAPGPRPFMQYALYGYLDSGEADNDLQDALVGMGFDATVIPSGQYSADAENVDILPF